MTRLSRDAYETSLQVIDNVTVIQRVRPPKELRGEQRAEFERVVATAPADWFSPSHVPTLCRYVQHLITGRKIDAAVENALADGDAEKIDLLLKAQSRESRTLLALATALRLTPRATSARAVSVKKLNTIVSPWRGGKQHSVEDEDAD